jgi:hypothetical protein
MSWIVVAFAGGLDATVACLREVIWWLSKADGITGPGGACEIHDVGGAVNVHAPDLRCQAETRIIHVTARFGYMELPDVPSLLPSSATWSRKAR